MAPPPDLPPTPPELLRNLVVGGYENDDLLEHVALPHLPGSYDVHVEFRGYDLETVRIEIIEVP